MNPNLSFSQSVRNMKKLLHIYQRRTQFQYFFDLLGKKLKRDILKISPKREIVDEYNKIFWLLIEHSYFSSIEEKDINVLQFIYQTWMKESPIIHEQAIQKNYQDLKKQLKQIMSEQYSNVVLMNLKTTKNNQDRKQHIQNIYQFLCMIRQYIPSQRSFISELQVENSFNLMIAQLQTEREEIIQQNIELLTVIKQNILRQGQSYQSSIRRSNIESIFEDSAIKQVLYIEDQLKYIEYQVEILQQRQIVQSVKLFLELKQQGKSSKYEASFEDALNISKYHYSQQQWIHFNKFRQPLYIQTNCIAWNSKLDFTAKTNQNLPVKHCHSYNNYKKGNQRQSQSYNSINEIISQMEMCHQCRYLYPKNSLKICGYSSLNHQKPKKINAYFDQYISNIELINLGTKYKVRQQIAIDNKNTNNYYSYTPKGIDTSIQVKHYQCNRYYCKGCLKGYSLNDKTVLCPFCLGLCNCSRCLRNDMIYKLKSLYLRLGGDMHILQDKSKFENLINRNGFKQKPQSITFKEFYKSNFNQKKRQCNSTASKHIKMYKIKKELQRLRILSFLLKKRQLLKNQIIGKKKRIFWRHLQKYKSQLF